ncbi:MAG: putative toxin-antitoxin system toxin component, PIN family [Rhodoferax sp.]|nr:putative toxin-antitoxin system toxin component, PIN family [Rhodoferax sp.]
MSPNFKSHRTVVLDTNIVLDAFVFKDTATHALLAALSCGNLRWLTTQAMRAELERVLSYPQIVKRLTLHQIPAKDVLVQFDVHSNMVDMAAKACVTCKDPDDQKFIDLAVEHRAQLLSKDKAVLDMTKRLLDFGVIVQNAIKNTAQAF